MRFFLFLLLCLILLCIAEKDDSEFVGLINDEFDKRLGVQLGGEEEMPLDDYEYSHDREEIVKPKDKPKLKPKTKKKLHSILTADGQGHVIDDPYEELLLGTGTATSAHVSPSSGHVSGSHSGSNSDLSGSNFEPDFNPRINSNSETPGLNHGSNDSPENSHNSDKNPAPSPPVNPSPHVDPLFMRIFNEEFDKQIISSGPKEEKIPCSKNGLHPNQVGKAGALKEVDFDSYNAGKANARGNFPVIDLETEGAGDSSHGYGHQEVDFDTAHTGTGKTFGGKQDF